MGAGLVDDHVEQFAGLLVLNDLMRVANHAKDFADAGLGVEAGSAELSDGGSAGVLGDELFLADVPATKLGDVHDLGRGEAFGGDSSELVPGVLPRGEECGGAVLETLEFVGHLK